MFENDGDNLYKGNGKYNCNQEKSSLAHPCENYIYALPTCVIYLLVEIITNSVPHFLYQILSNTGKIVGFDRDKDACVVYPSGNR